MAHFLALVAATKILSAGLPAVMSALVAENPRPHFLTAVAQGRHRLHTGWTLAIVAPLGALMATGKLLLAGASTGWRRHSTLDGRIYLGNVAGAVDWLDADPSARFAIADVTKVGAVVFSARQKLITNNLAPVLALRVTRPSGLGIDWTTYFLALVLLAIFHLIAHSLAPV